MTQNKHSKYSVHSVKWGIIKSSGGKDTLNITDDKQKYHMSTTVKKYIDNSINQILPLKLKVKFI